MESKKGSDSIFSNFVNTVKPFIFGGFAGCIATTCIQPIDTIKVRIQIHGEGSKGKSPNPILFARGIVAREGFSSLYRGLDSAYVR